MGRLASIGKIRVAEPSCLVQPDWTACRGSARSLLRSCSARGGRQLFSVATMIALLRRLEFFAQQPAFNGSVVPLYLRGLAFYPRPPLGNLADAELIFALRVICAVRLVASFAAAVLELGFAHRRAVAQLCVERWRTPSDDVGAIRHYSRAPISILGN
jgi:hypothetical protein